MTRWLFAAVVSLALAACGSGDNATPADESPSETPGPTVARKPPFEWGACEFDIDVGVTVDCGDLTVPEDRSRPDSPTIRLHVGVFESESEDPAADPMLYLGGGPGENSTEASSLGFEERIEPFLATRDYIVLDQRGTGFSRPSLDCPELDSAFKEHIDEDLTREQERALHQEAIFMCRDRLVSEGVNLAAYRSAESSADVEDLRLALGYDSWNIHGVSYGTRLALTVMRDFPEGVRSVVLDSTYPLQQNLYTAFPANARRAFDTFFGGCVADPACEGSYPSLESVFFNAVEELNAAPVTESITNPLSGETFDVTVLDGDALIEFLFQALYSTELIPLLPQIIYDVSNGDTSLMATILGAFFAQNEELFTPGMHFSVQCSDEVALTVPEEVVAANAAYPELLALTAGDAFSGDGVFGVCQRWGTAVADPKENQPVSSDIPTLVLAGEYDPITPPEWGQQAADTLSRHYFYVFPGVGHGVATAHDCPQSITMAFLADPSLEPDASCVGEMGGVDWAVE
jgi:pimeloyl-ACP methyl ester carboxylesterase